MAATDNHTDTVLVSVSCQLSPDAVEALTDEGRASVAGTPASPALSLVRARIVEVDAGARQEALERTLATALDQLQRCGVTGAQGAGSDVEIRVYLSLCPSSGQAGVVLRADMLMPWYELGAYVWVDALA